MKYSVLLPLAASAATAFVLPDAALTENILLAEGTINKETPQHSKGSSWWDSLPSKDDIVSSIDSTVKSSIDSALESISSAKDAAIGSLNSVLNALEEEEDSYFEEEDDFDIESLDGDHHHPGHGRKGGHGHHGHPGNANKTIYELIKESKYTTKFAKVIEDYPDIVKVLNSTKSDSTLFVPTDKAIERIPDHHKDKDEKPSKEFIEAVLKYHVAPGLFTARQLVSKHTIPTLYEPDALGGNPQRLRVRISLLSGLRVNYFSKVIAADIVAKNGLIHAVDHVIIPPPAVGRILKTFPQYFSTLLLAFKQTKVLDEFKRDTFVGGTFFAPTNSAFAKLGPAANAFLFSKKGEKYLAAILKYHIVANETFYSDAYYPGKAKSEPETATAGGRYHYDLPSLLDGQPISVDVRRFFKFISIRVNGWTKVSVQDGIASDGVIQVIDSVLLPAHKHDESVAQEEEISVEELTARLGTFVDEKKEQSVWGDL